VEIDGYRFASDAGACEVNPRPGHPAARERYPMKTLQQAELRVETYLIPRMGRLRRLVDGLVPDPRHARGLRHRLGVVVLAMVAGLLVGGSPRDAERLSLRLGLGRRGRAVSDTTMRALLAQLDDDALHPVLVQTVKDMRCRGQLECDGLRQHWTIIDGKYSTYEHHVGGFAQKFVSEDERSVWWRLGVLRAVLASVAGVPALGQFVMGPVETTETDPDKLKHTGEITNLRAFVGWLREQYGELTTNFSLDAGLWSKEIFAWFNDKGLGIFAGLKGNKPELHAEVERVMRIDVARRSPHAETGWEPSKKGQMKRELWRSAALDGWDGWRHLRQVILVRQTTRRRDGSPDEVEMRYFVTNMPTATLTPAQALLLVRRHWAIENDCNWTFDMQMGEDAGSWCTQNKAPLALGVLRMIAYNLMQWLRKRRVRVQHERVADSPMPWRELRELIAAIWIHIGAGLLARLCPAPSG